MTDRNVVIRLRGDIGDFAAKMAVAGRSVGGVVDKMTSGEKESKKFRDGLISVGDAGGKIGLGAAAALGGIIAVTANFEQKMSAVQAATHESAAAMGQLRDAAIEAGAKTAFSASEAAEGIENLAKAGVATKEILGGGLQGALDLAAAGTVDVAFAAETAATAMTQFGLSGEQVPHIADLLAAAAGKAQGEVSDMAYALRQSGLVANQVGLSIEETTAGLAAFASQGLLGSDAGTSFKTMLSSLTPNSEKAASAMERIGLAAYDANGNFVGLEEVARQLREGMADLTDEQRQSTLETIFGSDAVRAASVLYDEGARGIREWTDAVNDQGFAAETAAIKLDNLKGDFEALQGSLETALINLGTGSQGGLRGLTQGATDAVNVFNELPDAMQGTVTQMLAITAITGGGLWFGSKVVQGVANTREAIDNLGISAGRTGRVLKTAFTAGAILQGLNLIDDALDEVFDRNLDGSNLSRSLEAFADGTVSGALEETFGEDMQGFADNLSLLTSNWNIHSRALAKIPFGIGDALSGIPGFGGVQEAQENIQKLDEALAQMVETGESGQAAAIFQQLTRTAAEAGVDIATVRGEFGQYEVAVQNANGVTEIGGQILAPFSGVLDAVGAAAAGSASGVGELGGAMEEASAEAYTLENAMDLLFNQLDEGAAADAWTEGIQGLTESLKGGEGALSRLTETGRKNRDEIRQQIELLRDRAETEYESTGNMKLLERRILAGREAIIKQAQAAGIARDAMEKYLRELGLTPKEIRTTVRLMGADKAANDVDKVIYRVRLLREEIERMNRIQANIRVRGGAIDQGFANGGYTGNVPVDAIAGVVHGREFVHDAQTTAMFRPLFEYIHQNKRLPGGYQSGGYVQQISQPVTHNYGGMSLSDNDINRLARAMQMVRPLYGDVTVQGDGSFEREIRARRRAQAGGGR